LLVDKKIPPLNVPANNSVPYTAKEITTLFVKPESTAVQFVPLSVDRKTPFIVPAKRLVPETARVKIPALVNPVFAAVQFFPLSVDRKTPLLEVPAKIFVSTALGITAKELTTVSVKPLLT